MGDAGYEVTLETVTGIGKDITLRALRDRQQFHDPFGEAEKAGIPPAHWSLFGVLWPSGHVLAHAMLTFDIEGRRILELGCGLGLASLVLHRRGADITASDSHPLARAFLEENLRLNNFPPMKFEIGNWSRDDSRLGLFDLIIGSDLLYDRDQPRALSSFVSLHSAAAVEVVIADPDRANHGTFSRMMGEFGFSHTQQRIASLPGIGGPYKGRLHNYRRGPTGR